jgi:uncharacterized protein (DUF169 family)
MASLYISKEAAMTRDYSVLDKFDLERKPVGVKFIIEKPEGIKHIDKELNMCEMLKEAQENGAFYVAPEDWVCVGVEQMILGMKDPEPILVSGLFGGDEGLFKEASSCRAMYDHLPRLPKGSVQYVAFAPLDKLTFDPDVLILTANINQAQALLRSINYSTGEPFVSKATPVVACSWIYVYPVVSGELNYFITGLGLGMQALNIFPPGLFIISVPFQLIPIMLDNLKDISYSPTFEPGPGGDAHRKRVNKLMEDMRKRISD